MWQFKIQLQQQRAAAFEVATAWPHPVTTKRQSGRQSYPVSKLRGLTRKLQNRTC